MKKHITVLFLLLAALCGVAIISSCGSVPKVSDDASDFGKGAAVAQTFDVTNTDQWNAVIKAIDGGGNDKNYVINVTGTVTLSGIGDDGSTFTRAHRNVKMSLRGGGTFALSGRGSLIKLAEGEHLTLRNITLLGMKGWSDHNRPLVTIGKGAFLSMKDGAAIASNSGGGVYVNDDGTFTMNGGTISDNDAFVHGGGVYVSKNAVFTMNGGIISGNIVNSSDADSGGGVYVIGTFIMNNGNISGNTSKATGGGVAVGSYRSENAIFTINGGIITGNTSKEFGGGGVSVYKGATFTMNGGTIIGNISSISGGDDVIDFYRGGTFIMNGGTYHR